jgi:hypothetical protein
MGKLRTIISLAVVFTVAFAGTAVANHIYNDVPTNSVFHDEIAEIGDQGCADGFPGGLFKPEDPVKRQQMARFLSRCGGRVSYDDDTANLMGPSGTEFTLTDVEFTAHADGYVVVTATGTASTGQEGLCPCQVDWRLTDGQLNFSQKVTGQVDGVATSVGTTFESMAVTHVFPIGSGQTRTYSLLGSWVDDNLTAMNFSADITATYFPFDGTPVVN